MILRVEADEPLLTGDFIKITTDDRGYMHARRATQDSGYDVVMLENKQAGETFAIAQRL